MKKVFLLLFILGITTQAFADIKTKHIFGKWKYSVVTDSGEMTGFLKFAEKEGNLTGEVVTGDGDTFPMTKVEIQKGNVLYFELKPEYDVIKVKVKVEGKKFTGTVSTYNGEAPVTGEKIE